MNAVFATVFARGFIKCIAFVMTFSIEVSVHASELNIQQEPHDCLATKDVCAIQNLNESGFEVKIGDAVVTLDRASSLIRQSTNEIRLVSGTAWIQAQSMFIVTTEYGSVKNLISSGSEGALDGGDFWVSKNSQGLTAIAISADVELAPKGSNERLLVSQGLQNTLGHIGFNGQAATGIPLPIPFKDHVFRWARLYRGPKKDFEPQVDRFRAKWQQATEASAEINRSLYARKVASVDQAKRIEDDKKAKVEAENLALRKMFRQRMLNGT